MKKPILISVGLVILYTLIIMAGGCFGAAVAPVAKAVLLFILKWAAILFGYATLCYLPYRVIQALKLRDETTKKILEENKRIVRHNKEMAQKEKQKNLEEKIIDAYFKQEDEL